MRSTSYSRTTQITKSRTRSLVFVKVVAEWQSVSLLWPGVTELSCLGVESWAAGVDETLVGTGAARGRDQQ